MVLRLQNRKVKKYQVRGHSLPRVHVDLGREHHTASYSIDPAVRIEGFLERDYDSTVHGWILEHKATLLSLWADLQAGGAGQELLAELRVEFE